MQMSSVLHVFLKSFSTCYGRSSFLQEQWRYLVQEGIIKDQNINIILIMVGHFRMLFTNPPGPQGVNSLFTSYQKIVSRKFLV